MVLFKDRIKRLLAAFGYSISRIQKPSNAEYFNLTRFLNYYIERNGSCFLIQIGANDGVTFDPIHEFILENPTNVRGILLEPMKDAYAKLVENYKDFPNLIKENLAIHNTRKEMILYKVDPAKADQIGRWSGGMASFSSVHHELSHTPKKAIIEEKCSCVSFAELLAKHNVDKVDILQIDTEGYDAEIIMAIDFSKVKPSVIRFEHGYMDGIMDKAKLQSVMKTLNDNGYQLIIESYDATAYQPFSFI